MNFLAHAWLAKGGSDDFLYGNLIADGVKGMNLEIWNLRVAEGIRHHRRVDATIDRHPRVLAARQRAPQDKRRYAGIALDLVWDHFLARQQKIQPGHQRLIERCYRVLGRRAAPARLSSMIPVLIDQDWLNAYADFDFTCRAIAGIGTRLSGPNRLAELRPWLEEDYFRLEEDFNALWPELVAQLQR
ncbi:ACP phosphodiesterase [Pistricoccus aurantiacus]|uniref:DUF479 domain-containing protein n=1 Tax=Pistricoccus aurantiacus TaxID=1883414 RepID=A0A5B8STL0_9GAMM|nr:ACP phosphodiesterase [Pistricoccus aurantiacus]QEA40016.1 DUF479 domain-containing protein [Pistricoccus aurantiacus]